MSKLVSEELTNEFLQTLPHKTPFFVFSKKKILNNFEEFKKLFPNSLIHYALKANSEPHILKTLLEAGSGFEAASVYELNLLKTILVPAEKIIYGTSVKPIDQIKTFFNYGVNRFAFDSFPELEKIASVAPSSRVYVRAIANDSGSVFKFSEKFGADIKNIVPLIVRARELGLQPYGISFHVGSQASDPRAWANTIAELTPAIKELNKKGIKIEIINIGGGFPCQYASSEEAPNLDKIASYIKEQYHRLPFQPKLILEPGRGIVANTAVALATVIARVERKDSTWLFLDIGCYNGLYEAMAFQGSTRYAVTSLRLPKGSGESLFALAGPTGDSQDVITREALLPADIEVGEKVIFHRVGAYSLVVTSPFNGFPKPDTYFI